MSSNIAESKSKRGLYQRRIGFHNDCILGSENDLTYPLDKIDFFRKYVSDESASVLVGGETCKLNPPRTNCGSSLREFEFQHFTYLNNDYRPEVIDGWKVAKCYSDIRAKLGYKLSVSSVDFPSQTTPGMPLPLKITINNQGWAAPVRERPCFVVLAAPGGERSYFASGISARAFSPGQSSFVVTLRTPAELVAGRYTLYFSAPDHDTRLSEIPEYALPFENAEYIPKDGMIRLGEIDISKAPSNSSS